MANLKDVAALAGISVTTVSRVLNNRGYIGKETRKKVEAAMRQLNYHPNELARSLFRQRTQIIGLIVPLVGNPFFGALTEAIERYAAKKGFKILLCNSFHDRQKEIESIDMLKNNKVDGIIIGSRTSDLGEYMGKDLPFVSIDRIIEESAPCVAADNYNGGVLATTHLIEKNCRELVFIGRTPKLTMMANKRCEAFEDVCRKSNIPYVTVDTDESQLSGINYISAIEKMLDEHPGIDGIFASSDIIAAEVIQVLSARGRRVPDEVKVVGFDDTLVSSLTVPRITTIRQPIDEIGRYAVNILMEKIEGNIVPQITILPVTLIRREST